MTQWVLPIIDYSLCTRCGECVAQCPTQAVEMQTVGPVITHPEACTYCTTCESVCPAQAVRCEFEIVWESPNQKRGAIQ